MQRAEEIKGLLRTWKIPQARLAREIQRSEGWLSMALNGQIRANEEMWAKIRAAVRRLILKG
jgi:DNA transposition AAA+ family ATPase